MSESPVLPEYEGACVANVVPEIIKHLVGQPTADWLPQPIKDAKQVVLLVLDGLGWEQLQERRHLMPTLAAFSGDKVTSVAPTTTTTALTSIVTGRRPNATGILGYRMLEDGQILNLMKWRNEDGDATETIDAKTYQPQPSFAANDVPAIIRRQFIGTGFTDFMMHDAKVVPYAAASSIPVEIWRLVKGGEQFVYAYYDGIDTIAHAHGMGEHYEAELYTADRLIRDTMAGLPEGAALLVTADHGQVQVGNKIMALDASVTGKCWKFSGEARFRWLHVHEHESVDEVLNLTKQQYGDFAWIKTRQEIIDEGWFGGSLEEKFANRLGDIAIVASADVAFSVPGEDGHILQCRHGSLTAAEMYVPLLAQLA